MQSYPSPQILPHMGKDLSLLPLKYNVHGYLWPHGGVKLSFLWNAKLSFPSFSPKCNATLPHKSSPIYIKGRILPPSKCKTLKITNCSLQIPFYIFVSCYFIYLYFSIFFFFFSIWMFFSFFLNFFKTLEFFPKVEKLFPSVWGE